MKSLIFLMRTFVSSFTLTLGLSDPTFALRPAGLEEEKPSVKEELVAAMSRRDFLRVGGVKAAGVGLGGTAATTVIEGLTGEENEAVVLVTRALREYKGSDFSKGLTWYKSLGGLGGRQRGQRRLGWEKITLGSGDCLRFLEKSSRQRKKSLLQNQEHRPTLPLLSARQRQHRWPSATMPIIRCGC